MKPRTISQLARDAGVKVSTVRYYERRGILAAARGPSGYRSYDENSVRRLRFIRRAAELGFSLEEIELVLGASERGLIEEPTLRQAAQSKLADLDARIADLERVKAGIQTLLRRRKPGDVCPLLEALAPCD